jgi:hypothetical protein
MEIPKFSALNINSRGTYVFLFLFSLLIISLRRPEQFTNPEVWNEDGTIIIPGFINAGWQFLFEPMNGYLIIPSKLITLVSLKLSFEYYPTFSTFFGILSQSLCVLLVAISPTILPAKLLMAISLLFIPINPETYVLPQYTFWWTTILLVLALFWKSGNLVLRLFYILIGGFSSPLVVLLTPIFVGRALIIRKAPEYFATTLVLIIALIQYTLASQLKSNSSIYSVIKIDLFTALKKYIGLAFTNNNGNDPAIAFIFIFLLLIFGFFSIPRKDKLGFIGIILCLFAAIFASSLRVPPSITDPVAAGPRYFFFPFIFVIWSLIWIFVSARSNFVSLLAFCALGITLYMTTDRFDRRQDYLGSWALAARKCAAGDEVKMPVHFAGERSDNSSTKYSARMCQIGISQSLF